MEPQWIVGLLALVGTAILGLFKWAKFALLMTEIGQAAKATGDFLEKLANASADKKWTSEETAEVVAAAKILWSEWKDVLGVFRKK